MSKVSNKKIAQAIYEITKDCNDLGFDGLLSKITEYLAKKRLLSKSNEILNELQTIINKEENILEATLISRKPLTNEVIDKVKDVLKKRYKAKMVVTKLKQDANLLGGLRIEVQDEIIDLSLRSRLNQLGNHLIKYSL